MHVGLHESREEIRVMPFPAIRYRPASVDRAENGVVQHAECSACVTVGPQR